jgi:hypothetical protein
VGYGDAPSDLPADLRPLQRIWRPIYALELSLLECPGFALTLLHALWTGHDAGINGFVNLSALLMRYFGARFGVLGIYVTGRAREKQASATGEVPPTLVGWDEANARIHTCVWPEAWSRATNWFWWRHGVGPMPSRPRWPRSTSGQSR